MQNHALCLAWLKLLCADGSYLRGTGKVYKGQLCFALSAGKEGGRLEFYGSIRTSDVHRDTMIY